MSASTKLQVFPAWSRRAWLGLAIALAVAAGLALLIWPPSVGFARVRRNQTAEPHGHARDDRDSARRTVWFTLESSDSIGRIRNGQVERIPKGAESIEPLGLAVAADGGVWYTEAPKQRISRVSPDGSIASFGLSTPIARLGR